MNARIWELHDIYRVVVEGDNAATALLYVNPAVPCLTHSLVRALNKWNQGGRKGPSPRHKYTDMFVEEILKETYPQGWLPDQAQALGPEERIKVVTGKTPCPICKDAQEYGRLYEGATTGLRVYFREQCVCAYHRFRWSIMGDTRIVPLRFQNISFAGLQPSSLSKMTTKNQEDTIKTLKDHPRHCYFIYGPHATGKTHYSLALLEHAVSEWAYENFVGRAGYIPERTIFRVTTKTWLDETHAYRWKSYDDETTPLPALNVSVIRNLAKYPGAHILVIFDEIDKFVPNDGRLSDLFEMVNMCSECNVQLIATSNQSPAELIKRWNSSHAGPILRRFHDSQGGERRILLPCLYPVDKKGVEKKPGEGNSKTAETVTGETTKEQTTGIKEPGVEVPGGLALTSGDGEGTLAPSTADEGPQGAQDSTAGVPEDKGRIINGHFYPPGHTPWVQ